jgi:ABC-2 type transport system permease protein
MSSAGLGTMARIQLRTRWKGLVIWVLALAASLAGTAVSIASLYDTPAKIQTYADAVAGGALYAINGKIEGINSLGGVVQDEFGFMAAFLLPLLGISLIAGSTRREEEAGRLELLLSGRIGRRSPVTAALLVASGTVLAVIVAFALALIPAGVPTSASILYAASLGSMAFVFAALAALLAQITLHARGVYFGGFGVLLAAYVVRGVGDVTGSWVTWLSPLGWQEKTAPTGDQRWWVLLVPLLVGVVLGAAAIHLAGRRDLGSALIGSGAGPDRASARLRSPIGFAVWVHRQSLLGWLLGAIVLAVMMGALAQQVIDAITGNPAMAEAIGAGGAHPEDGFVAMVQLYVALIAIGYVIQATGVVRREEAEGRLESRLAGTLSRTRWLAAHTAVILTGLVVIVVVSSVLFGLSAAASMGDTSQVGRLLLAGLAYLPAELVFAGLALVLFGLVPRLFAVAWACYAAVAFIAFLGPGLKLPGLVLDLAPTTHVGNPPLGTVEALPLVVLAAIAAALFVAAVVGFRRRGVPQS